MEDTEPDEPPSRPQRQHRPRVDADDGEVSQDPDEPPSRTNTFQHHIRWPRSKWHAASSNIAVWISHATDLICCSRISLLLIFVPIGITVEMAKLDPIAVFILNALAIIPLAVMISTATETIAQRLGDTAGALLNVSVGNTAELMIFLIALAKGQIDIVQASLLGSILTNLVLVLGSASVCAHYKLGAKLRDRVTGRLGMVFLGVGLLVGVLPVTILARTRHLKEGRHDKAILGPSRGISIALIVVYLAYLFLEMRMASGKDLYEESMHRSMSESDLPMTEYIVSDDAFESSEHHSRTYLPLHIRGKPTTGPISGFQKHIDTGDTPSKGIIYEYESPLVGDDSPVQIYAREQTFASKQNTTEQSMQLLSDSQRQNSIHDEHSYTQASPASAAPSSPRDSSDGSEPTFQATRSSIGSSTDRDSRSSVDSEHPILPCDERSSYEGVDFRPACSRSEHRILGKGRPPLPAAIAVLMLATAVVSVSTEMAVDAIPAIVESWHITHVFIGFIVLPVVGNAAEHVTAAKLAMAKKMVLAKKVAVESSAQVVLLITPAMVLLAWARGRGLTLAFDVFETAGVMVAAVVVCAVLCYGSTGWRQGAMLWGMFGAFAIGSLFYRGQ